MKRPRGGARRRQHDDSNTDKRDSTPSPSAKARHQPLSTSPTPSSPLQSFAADPRCELADNAFLAFRREYLDNPTCPDNGIWFFLGSNGFRWGSDQPPTCFNLAAMAVNLAVSAVKTNNHEDVEESRAIYSRALVKTRDALCEDPVRPTDELLMTCILLSAYEVIFSNAFRNSLRRLI
jgi:hypothetical protein